MEELSGELETHGWMREGGMGGGRWSRENVDNISNIKYNISVACSHKTCNLSEPDLIPKYSSEY